MRPETAVFAVVSSKKLARPALSIEPLTAYFVAPTWLTKVERATVNPKKDTAYSAEKVCIGSTAAVADSGSIRPAAIANAESLKAMFGARRAAALVPPFTPLRGQYVWPHFGGFVEFGEGAVVRWMSGNCAALTTVSPTAPCSYKLSESKSERAEQNWTRTRHGC